MILRWIGAICIVIGSGFIGLAHTYHHKKTVNLLKQVISAVDYMERELKYRHPPVPELFSSAAEHISGTIGELLKHVAIETELRFHQDVRTCFDIVMEKSFHLPDIIVCACQLIGSAIGEFDISGQIENLNNVHSECLTMQDKLTEEQDIRMRSFQTLALCCGAAVAILLI
ncbi:MAG: stage III sporulation protein AB [Oscillospiraceae bacterium]|nr:stage III sporulation protein AB [Oscillospiraceae bacterium]